MKIYIIILLIGMSFLPANIIGQVTIGADTEPHESAVLDVKASDKGFLGPRVALTGKYDNATIPNPASGLLVINTSEPDMSQPEEERVYPYIFYYWVEDPTPRWERFIGHDELEYWVEEEIKKWAMPLPAMFYMNGRDLLETNRYGGKDFMYGVSSGSSKPIPLTNNFNRSDGNVTLKPGTESTIILEPGIYNIIFAYLFISPNTYESPCNISSYFMDFPFYANDGSARKNIRIYSTTYHAQRQLASHASTMNFVAPIRVKTEWEVRLGAWGGSDSRSCKPNHKGLSLPNRNTFVYITKVGDWIP